MRSFPLSVMALAMFSMLGVAKAQSNTELQKITVTGEGDKLGTGLIMEEDAPKARSSVSKAQLEKIRSSGNPFQALALLPGVNSSSQDATGLFGGNLRVRGFNSDQMGFTINGAPVNDSGNFAVFPQEYVDSENLCSLYVTQGAPDTDAPHVGASGGNVGILSCAPESVQRTRIAVSGGQLGFYRLYGRVDTGKVGGFRGYMSISQTEADKWKGPGLADRKHLDAGGDYDFGGGNKFSANLLFNRAFTNNFRAPVVASSNPATPSLANGLIGYNDDFSSVIPQHLKPVNGTVQNEAAIASGLAYYGYSLSPFQNYLLSGKATIVLNDRLHLDVTPYFWYGLGTGGTQQNSLKEGAVTGGTLSSSVHGGLSDINGDGDKLDTVLVYRGSLTQTFRPGVSGSLTYDLDNQKITGGVWAERARQRQTQPAAYVDNSGGISDPWLGSNLVHYNDGTLYEGRNWNTVSVGKSVFLQDVIDLADHRVQVTPAFSYRTIQRNFSNYGNSGAGGGADYSVEETYSAALPSLAASWQPTDRLQLFTSIAKNFRAPNTSEYGNIGQSVTVTNGVGTYATLQPLTIKPEKAINLDIGARYRGDMFRVSGTAFSTWFKDRIATSYDPGQNLSHDTNVGPSKTIGLELEGGTVPFHGYSAYASLTYTKSTIQDNLLSAANTYAPTAGKIFPDTPKGMAALSVQYAEGPYLLNIAGKYTTTRYLTLTNDVPLAAYTTFDLNAAYKLPNLPGNSFKNPVIRLNVSNLFNRQYLNANAGSGVNIALNSSGSPVAYPAAPRFSSVTFQVDY